MVVQDDWTSEQTAPSHRSPQAYEDLRVVAGKAMRLCPSWAPDTPPRSRHVRFAPEADKRADVSLSPLCTRSVVNAVQQTVFIRAPRRRGRAAEAGTPIAPQAHALLRARVSAT